MPLIAEEIKNALAENKPVVALESTVIAHGLPRPKNLETALALEDIVRQNGAIPATIAILDGRMRVGLSPKELEFLASSEEIKKASIRDIPIALAKEEAAATTVSATIYIAHRVGIKIFATGGIGGVHRNAPFDVSADLPALASTPIITVCSGAKSVLDLYATREWLETYGVPILGYQCDEMPAFYSISSGLDVDCRVENAKDVARIASACWKSGMKQTVLVGVPVPKNEAIEQNSLQDELGKIQLEAKKRDIRGKDVTPHLLNELAKKSRGTTLKANIALLRNNANIAAQIAQELY